eukprot:jgi/Phyca11/18705/fgenesh1_pg.PHYCAscaffold_39_\
MAYTAGAERETAQATNGDRLSTAVIGSPGDAEMRELFRRWWATRCKPATVSATATPQSLDRAWTALVERWNMEGADKFRQKREQRETDHASLSLSELSAIRNVLEDHLVGLLNILHETESADKELPMWRNAIAAYMSAAAKLRTTRSGATIVVLQDRLHDMAGVAHAIHKRRRAVAKPGRTTAGRRRSVNATGLVAVGAARARSGGTASVVGGARAGAP